MKRVFLGAVVALTLWLMNAATLHADYIQTWTLNTSALEPAHLTDTFTINMAIFDGSTGDGVGNNTATVTASTVGGGGLDSSSTTVTGGASGDLTTGATLTDSGFFNSISENFTPGSTLKFTLDLTLNVSTSEGNGSGAPDAFTFTITDSAGQVTYDTNAQNLGNNLLAVDITGSPPTIQTGGYLFSGSGPFDPSPLSAVPAPSSLVLLLSAAATLVVGVSLRRLCFRLASLQMRGI